MKVAVVGVGAMGCLLGAQLGDIGDVTLIGHWPEQVRAIRDVGIWLEHPDGSRTHHRPLITDNPGEIGPVDLALVLVKSRQTSEAAETIAEILKPDGLAITLQNGINNCSTLRGVLGIDRVTLGVTSEGATVLGVAEIRHAGHGPTHIGRDSSLGGPQLDMLAAGVELFIKAGFETYLVEETDSLVWGKLAINAAINPLTALLRVPNGFLLDHEELVDIMELAAQEVANVAAAQGIALPFPNAAERAKEVARATGNNQSSMFQDVARGVPTEIEAICGAVARIGREHGVSTPVNIRLCRLVKRIEENGSLMRDAGDVKTLIQLLDHEDL